MILGRQKDKQIKIYVNEKELEMIKKRVEKSKLSQQNYLLKCALNKEIIVVEDLKKTFVELRKQGNNLNQLTKSANEGKVNFNTENLQKELSETWQLLRQLIQKVR